MFDFFTSFRLIAAFLIGFIVDEDFRPVDEQIKRIVDDMIDAIVPMGGQEYHDNYGCTVILEGDNTRIEAMIDCYVMDMAWVKITLTGDDNTEELLICYTVFDDGDIQSTISYNDADIVA